jgi:hypothetical protein
MDEAGEETGSNRLKMAWKLLHWEASSVGCWQPG